MAANEFLEGPLARAEFTVLASTATQALTSGVYLPAGALVTGVTFMNTGAVTIANASGSIDLRVANTQLSSSVALVSTGMIKNIASVQTIPTVLTLSYSGGVRLPQSGELVLSVQATSGTAVHTWAPSVFVGYVV
jgi:hypothetical protein